MIIVVDKVAQTRFAIEREPELETHDDPPFAPTCAVEVTFSGVDFKGRFEVLLTNPDDVAKFLPGEAYDVALIKREESLIVPRG